MWDVVFGSLGGKNDPKEEITDDTIDTWAATWNGAHPSSYTWHVLHHSDSLFVMMLSSHYRPINEWRFCVAWKER